MSDVEQISNATVKARKARHCLVCGAVAVQPGETYERDVLKFDGRLYTWVQCSECNAIRNLVHAWAFDAEAGCGTDEYNEWANELKDDPEQGEAARAYLARREAGR